MTFECSGPNCQPPAWMRTVLVSAGLYNIAFGFWAVVWPGLWFEWCEMDAPAYPMIWQSVGVILGLFGVGYLIASTKPLHHWPIVFVGFLAKILGPIGFVWAITHGTLPLSAAWLILFNHVVWWVPFAMILWITLQAHVGRPPSREEPYPIEEAAELFKLSDGRTLMEASQGQTLALVFLRHFGCTFTKQLLKHLQEIKDDIEKRGGRLVLIHMLERGQGKRYIRSNAEVARIADPYCELYRSFGLGKAGFWELLGPKVWLHGFINLFHGCAQTKIVGDGMQMPGAFLFRDGRIVSAQPARSAADLPDVARLFEAAV